MKRSEINALETRYKATALMLINLDLMTGEIDQYMEYGHMAFDEGRYELCVKVLDLVSLEVVNKLEI